MVRQVCSLRTGLAPPTCTAADVAGNIDVRIDREGTRATGPVRYAKADFEPRSTRITLTFLYGADSRMNALTVAFRSAPQVGSLAIDPSASPIVVEVIVDNRFSPVSKAFTGDYKATRGTVTVTSIDARYGGHVEGTVDCDLAGGSDKEPVAAHVTMTFSAKLPT